MKLETNIIYDNSFRQPFEEIASLGIERVMVFERVEDVPVSEKQNTVYICKRGVDDIYNITCLRPVYIAPYELRYDQFFKGLFMPFEHAPEGCDVLVMCQDGNTYSPVCVHNTENNITYFLCNIVCPAALHRIYIVLRELNDALQSTGDSIFEIIKKESPPTVYIRIGDTMMECEPKAVSAGDHIYDRIREETTERAEQIVSSLRALYDAKIRDLSSKLETLKSNTVPVPKWDMHAALKGISVLTLSHSAPITFVMPVKCDVNAYGGWIDGKMYFFKIPDDLREHIPKSQAYLYMYCGLNPVTLDRLILVKEDGDPYPHVHVSSVTGALCIGDNYPKVADLAKEIDLYSSDGYQPLLKIRAIVESSLRAYYFDSPYWSEPGEEWDEEISEEDNEIQKFLKVYRRLLNLFEVRREERDTSDALMWV